MFPRALHASEPVKKTELGAGEQGEAAVLQQGDPTLSGRCVRSRVKEDAR